MCSTTGVSALPKSKSHLSANCRGICFCTGSVGHFFAGLPPTTPPAAPSSRLGSFCPVSPSFWSRTQVPVSCPRSYCQPFRTPSQGETLHSSGSCLWFFLIIHLCPPPSMSISFHPFLRTPLLFSYWPVFPECCLSSLFSRLLPPFHSPVSPSPLVSLSPSHSPFPSCPSSSPHTFYPLLSHTPLCNISVL